MYTKSFLFGMAVVVCSTLAGAEEETSKLRVEPYGYFKLDLAYDSSATNNVDFPFYVNPNDQNDGKFTIHARQTRLGMRFFGPEVVDADAKARVEIDFTKGDDDFKYLPALRHAYGELKWEHVSVLAGQTSDVISPLVPVTVKYIVAWNGGNIGYRKPQLRLTGTLPAGNSNVIGTLALARNQGGDYPMPQIQARLGLHGSFFDKPAQLGISGHYNREDEGTGFGDLLSYSTNFDLRFPFAPWGFFHGEFFLGENLDAHLGGIAQGVNPTTGVSIASLGGWGQIGLLPCEWFEGYVGAAVDNPDDGDLSTGMRKRNVSIFTSVHYLLSKEARIQFEYEYMKTAYANASSADNNRYQLAFVYNLPK